MSRLKEIEARAEAATDPLARAARHHLATEDIPWLLASVRELERSCKALIRRAEYLASLAGGNCKNSITVKEARAALAKLEE